MSSIDRSINFLCASRVFNGQFGRRGALCISFALVFGVALCWAPSASAVDLVNDTWQDGNRNQPDAPTNAIPYAENNGQVGVDADSDDDLESRWFRGGSGTLDPVGLGGPLRGTMDTTGTSSASWTTYFTDAEGNEVELIDVGDKMCITWVFTLDNVNTSNTSQDFRIAVVDSPNNRLASNGSPGSATYAGYATFGNMGQTFGHARPFDLMTWTGGSNALLSAAAAWTSTGDNGLDDGTNGNPGYVEGVEYTYTFMAERLVGDELLITMRMDGAGLDGVLKNYLLNEYTDTSPDSFSFDTFALRPGRHDRTAEVFDTSLFRVEFKPIIPEPGSLVLAAICGLSLLTIRRRR